GTSSATAATASRPARAIFLMVLRPSARTTAHPYGLFTIIGLGVPEPHDFRDQSRTLLPFQLHGDFRGDPDAVARNLVDRLDDLAQANARSRRHRAREPDLV